VTSANPSGVERRVCSHPATFVKRGLLELLASDQRRGGFSALSERQCSSRSLVRAGRDQLGCKGGMRGRRQALVQDFDEAIHVFRKERFRVEPQAREYQRAMLVCA
jgi:hypothetical protein